MDPYFRCDHAYIAARKDAGAYKIGDERPKHAACDLCRKEFILKRGDLRDLQDHKLLVRCRTCIEREDRYRDYLKMKDA